MNLGRAPRLIAADPGFFSAANEAAATAQGVKRVCIPSHATKSPSHATKSAARQRWFATARNGGPAASTASASPSARHGLNRCRYKREGAMKPWVGLGVIADNVINIGRAMDKRVLEKPAGLAAADIPIGGEHVHRSPAERHHAGPEGRRPVRRTRPCYRDRVRVIAPHGARTIPKARSLRVRPGN
jgi:hypothetical protein